MSTAIRLLQEPLLALPYGADRLDPDDIDIEQIAPHGWRICDARLPRGHANRLLGFVEKRANRYEVMQLGRGSRWFLSMGEALVHFQGDGPENPTTDLPNVA